LIDVLGDIGGVFEILYISILLACEFVSEKLYSFYLTNRIQYTDKKLNKSSDQELSEEESLDKPSRLRENLNSRRDKMVYSSYKALEKNIQK
jgi:hypothetical protein